MSAMNGDSDALHRIERLLEQLVARTVAKSHYTVDEFAALVKRAPFTCREWCRLGRIRAERSMTQTGPTTRWVISHQEYERFLRAGLLPRGQQVQQDDELRPQLAG